MVIQLNLDEESEILKAMGHPIRLKILIGLIEEDECHVNKMVDELNINEDSLW